MRHLLDLSAENIVHYITDISGILMARPALHSIQTCERGQLEKAALWLVFSSLC